jgi:flavin-dependent dehydrogenase
MRRISPEFLSIAQIAFAPRSHWEDDVMMIGDAAELIAPLCGDGMAMAMRSAEICAPLVADYLHSRRAAPHLKAQYVNSWEREFRARLRWGGLLQFVLLHPPLASGAVRLLSRFPTMGQFLIEQTRDTKILRAHQNATGL